MEVLVLRWLVKLGEYIKEKSFGLTAIRVFDYNDVTFGIIEPYGYYVINTKNDIYLLRDVNLAIKFYIRDGKTVTSLVDLNNTNLTFGYIDNLFLNLPATASRVQKIILYNSDMPQYYTAIDLINRCLDLRILSLGE